MKSNIPYQVIVNDRKLEDEATRILRAAGISPDGRPSKQAPNGSQRAFERRLLCCGMAGYSRKR